MNPERTVVVCVATSPSRTAVAKEGLRFAYLLGTAPVFLNMETDTPEHRQALMDLIQKAGKADIDESALLIRPGDPYSVIVAADADAHAHRAIAAELSRESRCAIAPKQGRERGGAIDYPDRLITVIVPEIVENHWWYALLHSRRASRLRSAIRARQDVRVIVIDLPWFIKE